jgi:hypothetical protein
VFVMVLFLLRPSVVAGGALCCGLAP